MKVTAGLIALIVTLSVARTFAEDWPQYYGPRRDGTSTEKGLLRTWPKEGPKVLWTAPVGIGYGGPVVSGGKVYLLDRDDKVGDKLRCLDFATGKELWSFAYDAPGRFDHPGSRTHADCGWRQRLYLRPARRPALRQHEHPQARLAQEHLEGLRRRAAAQVGASPRTR